MQQSPNSQSAVGYNNTQLELLKQYAKTPLEKMCTKWENADVLRVIVHFARTNANMLNSCSVGSQEARV